ncbi:hypothetical protein DVH05_004896 [Phytophthora capsici]|nr:hypothetical protein DVH05_004896 [Phytophthora capsici]
MTDGDNYDRYRGGEGQNGETKNALAERISALIAAKGIETVRTAKDITYKISELESTFRSASDWLAATGQGVTDEQFLRACVLQRCPEYYHLKELMDSRASTRPQLLNTDPSTRKSDTDDSDTNSNDDVDGDTPSLRNSATLEVA